MDPQGSEAALSGATYSGELRRLPPSTGVRIVQALSLWLLFKNAAALFARLAFGYRHAFDLAADGRQLILTQRRTLWGKTIRTAKTVLPLEKLQEITLEKSGESPTFLAGLSSLILGTVVGFHILSIGVRAPGGAPWLLTLGALFVIAGLALDFFLGSGRSHQTVHGAPQLLLRVAGERGFILTRLKAPAAETVLEKVQSALASGDSLQFPPDSQAPAQES